MNLPANDKEKDLEAAILGAQMLINNPEAALEALLGNDIYPHLQEMQQNGREGSFTSSQLVHSEQPDVGSRTQSLQAGAMDASGANSTPQSQSELAASHNTPLEAALQAVLNGASSANLSAAQQRGTQRQEQRDTTSLLSELSGHLEANTNVSSSQNNLSSPLRASLASTMQALTRASAPPVGHAGGDATATRGDSFVESHRLLSDLQNQLEAGGGVHPMDTAAAHAASHSELPNSLKTALDVAVHAIMRSSTPAAGVARPGIALRQDSDTSRKDGRLLLTGERGDNNPEVNSTAQPMPAMSAALVPGGGAAAAGGQQPLARPAVADDGTRCPIVLYSPADDTTLSRYQCLVRQQIEMFEATDDDVQFNISRMSKIIVLGQVGLRCRHCAILPEHSRPKAAVYYPRTLDSVYQFGQNMVKNHLLACCSLIPNDTKNLMMALQESRKRGRGGRDRWARAAQEIGVIEDENGLRFA